MAAELEINPETVCRLISLAREFHAQEGVSFPENPGSSSPPDHEASRQMLEGHTSDATLQEFRGIVEALGGDHQQQLVALLWLGRGDYEVEEWEDAVAYAAEAGGQDTATYLLDNPLLSEHLEKGLELHGHRCD